MAGSVSREAGNLRWKAGFEVEMLAPRGRSRRDLAEALAAEAGGRVARVFHAQSEPSKVPGLPVFENLTLAFDALDASGAQVARCADDLTLNADLDRAAPPLPGWYRIVSDDARFLRLLARHCDPEAPLERVLEPAARLFGVEPVSDGEGMVRLADEMGQSIAIAASLPSERERPCELITPPLEADHEAALGRMLETAAGLGFTVPLEAAVHVHFDAAPLRDAAVLARLVRLLDRHGAALRERVGTNSNCLRLAPISGEIVATVSAPGFEALSWDEVQARFAEVGLTKYCDFNLMNFLRDIPGKPTFEVRILPGSMDAAEILAGAALFEGILRWCVEGRPADAFHL